MPFEHYISNQISFSLFFMNHSKKYISLSSSKLKFQTRDQQLLHRNGFKAGLPTNLTSYVTVKSFVVGSRIMMSCRWRLLGHNEWGLWLQGQSEGAIVVGMGIFCFNFFIWVLFGFEVWIMWCLMVRIVWVWKWWVGSDGWCRGGRRLLGHTMLANGSGFCFEFFFFFCVCVCVWCK